MPANLNMDENSPSFNPQEQTAGYSPLNIAVNPTNAPGVPIIGG